MNFKFKVIEDGVSDRDTPMEFVDDPTSGPYLHFQAREGVQLTSPRKR